MTEISVASGIRLALDLHREEIEIMRLMGATESAIRAPFWLHAAFVERYIGSQPGAQKVSGDRNPDDDAGDRPITPSPTISDGRGGEEATQYGQREERHEGAPEEQTKMLAIVHRFQYRHGQSVVAGWVRPWWAALHAYDAVP